MSGAVPDRVAVDFNAILRNRHGAPYRTEKGAALRLGQVVVEAIDASGSPRPHVERVDADEKRRRDALASAIVRDGLDDDEAGPPYNRLLLPHRLLRKIDRLLDEMYLTGIYTAARRLLFPDDLEVPAFEDVDVLPADGSWEQDDGTVADVSHEPEAG